MLYFVSAPAQPLGHFIERFWFFSDAPPHLKERIVPSGTFELPVGYRQASPGGQGPATGLDAVGLSQGRGAARLKLTVSRAELAGRRIRWSSLGRPAIELIASKANPILDPQDLQPLH